MPFRRFRRRYFSFSIFFFRYATLYAIIFCRYCFASAMLMIFAVCTLFDVAGLPFDAASAPFFFSPPSQSRRLMIYAAFDVGGSATPLFSLRRHAPLPLMPFFTLSLSPR